MPADAIAPSLLIDGQFQVDLATTLHGGGGLEAFAVLDRHGAATDLMAILSRPTAPARATALAALLGQSIDHLLVPLAHGPAPAPGGTEGWFVISRAPGPAIWPALRPWSEADLLNLVLRPAAQALDRLQTRRVTHRAIRPDNIFQARAGEPVTLEPDSFRLSIRHC